MNPLALITGNPLYLAIAAAVIFAAGAGSGWQVNGWRLGTQLEIEKSRSQSLSLANDNLVGANQRCSVNVAEVQKAVKGIADESAKLTARAAAAMNKAAGKALSHMAKADEILNRPPVVQSEWCATIIREEAEYVVDRHKLRLSTTLSVTP